MRVALTGHRAERLGLPENEADDAWEKIEEWIVKQLFKMNEVCYLEREFRYLLWYGFRKRFCIWNSSYVSEDVRNHSVAIALCSTM